MRKIRLAWLAAMALTAAWLSATPSWAQG